MVPTLSRVQALRADVDDHSRGRWSLPGVLGPLALAAFQLAGTFGASREQPERRAVDLVAVLLVLAGPAALLWVRSDQTWLPGSSPG